MTYVMEGNILINKKIMILTVILVSLFAVSAVSAADNATGDAVSVEETTDEIVSVEENQVILRGTSLIDYISFSD